MRRCRPSTGPAVSCGACWASASSCAWCPNSISSTTAPSTLARASTPCCIGSRQSSSRTIPNHKTRRAASPTMNDHAEGAPRRKLRNVHGIARRDAAGIDAAAVAAVLPRFTGPIQQIPPMHSAIKHQGQPLYKLAHQGIEIERPAREVSTYELRLTACRGDRLDFEVGCSKGTYIRTLAEDIGEALGVGAHVVALRRAMAGPFRAEQMISLEHLQALAEQGAASLDAALLPMEAALAQWPDVCLSDDMAYYLRQGQPVFVSRAPTSGWVKLCTADRRFLGVGRVMDDGRVAPKRLVNDSG